MPGLLEFAVTPPLRLKGLLGRRDYEGVLLIAPCNDVHTLGMRMNLDIAFADRDGRVLKSMRNVGANRRLRCRDAVAVLERRASAQMPWPSPGSRLTLGFDSGNDAGIEMQKDRR